MVCRILYLYGLKNVLLVLVYLILVVTLPSSNSAPTNIRMSSRIRDEHPKWVNPCGLSNMDTTDSIPQLNTSDLKTYFEQILNIAGLAFQKADQLKVNFTRKTFNRDFDDLFKEQSYYWLPNLPKYEHKNYDNDQIKKTLLEAYENLQKVAVGVEQVVWDQQDRPGLFPDGFKELEDYLIAVLCELQMVISEMNINIPSDVPREHMPESQRFNLDVTASNVRDFIIMREALTTLEYIRDEFRDLAKAKKL
ncbi:hypothetical protein JTB14_002426 [Gonioctena quinquepunctata]|nr:hypothetical protein JTB14_002426 [Gonioctena quinquepunctata]